MDTFIQYLIPLLESENSHENFNTVVGKFPQEHINTQIPGTPYTPWHLIEHIRIAQRDNIDYVIGKNYKPLEWPNGYWPEPSKKATYAVWQRTIQNYNKDLAQFKKIIEKSPDLFAVLPHTESATIVRQVFIVVDHTAYHVGELSFVATLLKIQG